MREPNHANGRHIRKYPRMNAEIVVAYRRLAPGGEPRITKTRTLGLGGLMICIDEPLAQGERLALEVMLEGTVVAVESRVVYTEPDASGAHQVGLEYTRISDEDRERLLAYYLQHEYRIPAE
jgi:predicted NUDIX family phosphoesterase